MLIHTIVAPDSTVMGNIATSGREGKLYFEARVWDYDSVKNKTKQNKNNNNNNNLIFVPQTDEWMELKRNNLWP